MREFFILVFKDFFVMLQNLHNSKSFIWRHVLDLRSNNDIHAVVPVYKSVYFIQFQNVLAYRPSLLRSWLETKVSLTSRSAVSGLAVKQSRFVTDQIALCPFASTLDVLVLTSEFGLFNIYSQYTATASSHVCTHTHDANIWQFRPESTKKRPAGEGGGEVESFWSFGPSNRIKLAAVRLCVSMCGG